MVRIPALISADQVAQMRDLMAKAEWVDGRVTAGAQSGQMKHNLQIPENSLEARALDRKSVV